eukprot:CAMPEP_0173462260 /NCGR_PEP_ID=MMETSP1357-20121228/66366_1 /TAXON_ID=77926 /ORGANISM="Hemiselmis rufescens, Strain PCC563" /LENGTH=44 /DNA_ID= /DNA_START= /DNA_END= /DNA_ORIENTATION=
MSQPRFSISGSPSTSRFDSGWNSFSASPGYWLSPDIDAPLSTCP